MLEVFSVLCSAAFLLHPLIIFISRLWPFRFEVSKLVWDMLLTKCMELRHLKHKYGPFGSKKSSGRYRPYSNVDSFLKVIHHYHIKYFTKYVMLL